MSTWELLLIRRWLTERSTIGELFIVPTPDPSVGPRIFECFMLEDFYRLPGTPKVPGKTCIPNGRYQVVISHSARFGFELPELLAVPGFSGIRIHPGNTDVDTEGCLIPGRDRLIDRVQNSGLAQGLLMLKLRTALGRSKAYITISCEPVAAC